MRTLRGDTVNDRTKAGRRAAVLAGKVHPDMKSSTYWYAEGGLTVWEDERWADGTITVRAGSHQPMTFPNRRAARQWVREFGYSPAFGW